MNRFGLFIVTFVAFTASCVWAASDLAPVVPDLNLPADDAFESSEPLPEPTPVQEPSEAKPVQKPQEGSRRVATRQQFSAPRKKSLEEMIEMSDFQIDQEGDMVQKMNPVLPPIEALSMPEKKTVVTEPAPAVEQPTQISTETVQETMNAAEGEEFVPARDEQKGVSPVKTDLKVSFNPATDRDPTLSPDDNLLLKHREEERLRAIEAEKQRKIDAERRRLEELERQRQLELERLRDPSREIRGKIRINGIVGDEVFIGDKVYGVGKTVLGARIISVQPDSVVFIYKGQKFTKKVQLQ